MPLNDTHSSRLPHAAFAVANTLANIADRVVKEVEGLTLTQKFAGRSTGEYRRCPQYFLLFTFKHPEGQQSIKGIFLNGHWYVTAVGHYMTPLKHREIRAVILRAFANEMHKLGYEFALPIGAAVLEMKASELRPDRMYKSAACVT